MEYAKNHKNDGTYVSVNTLVKHKKPGGITHLVNQPDIPESEVGQITDDIKSDSTITVQKVGRNTVPTELAGENTESFQKEASQTCLPDSIKTGLEQISGLNLSDVRVHHNSEKPYRIGAFAFTRGADIYIAPGQEHHLPHEAWHVVQQMQGRVRATNQAQGVHVNNEPGLEKEADEMGRNAVNSNKRINRNGPHSYTTVKQEQDGIETGAASPIIKPVIQMVAPVVVGAVIWFGKALAATSIDGLIDFAIAAITGMPPPGFWGHVGNFFINLVPGLGEAKKIKKAAKLFMVIDKIVDIVKVLNKLQVPGASNLLKRMTKEADYFKEAIKVADLSGAKAALGRLLGFLREAQVVSKLKEGGAKIVQMGKNIKVGRRVVTEIDIVTEEAGKVILNQVKAGSRAVLTPGSTDWVKFTRQVDETVKASKEIGAKVRYVVDAISDEAREYLTSRNIEIRLSSEILK